MGCGFFVRYHSSHSYCKPSAVVTVADNLTSIDMYLILNDLSYFNSEDCCDSIMDLIDEAAQRHIDYGKKTNVFKILKKQIVELNKEYGNDEEGYEAESSIWTNLSSTVDDLVEDFKKLANEKLKPVDFDTHLNKIAIYEKLSYDEMLAISNLSDAFYEAVNKDDFDNDSLSVINRKLSKIVSGLPKLLEKKFKAESENGLLKSALKKCNFKEVLIDYISNVNLVKLALYQEYEMEGETFLDNLDDLYFQLKELNEQ